MYIINHRKIFFMLSTLLIAGSVLAVFVYGFNLGIDFKGGSLLEISYATSRPAPESIKESLDTLIICIVLFITFAFRKVSRPVASWKYGLATIVALAHDVIIPTGIFVTWTHFRGGEIDLLFVTALLAILVG